MGREAQEGIRPHITRLLQQGILVPCKSPWNTPLLPVKKPRTNDYLPVQDLREVNKRVQDIYSTVPNPYSLLRPERTWYTVLDLKDAFFCLRLHPNSQLLFAFEWQDQKVERLDSSHGRGYPRDSKIDPLCLIRPCTEALPLFKPTIPR